MTPPTTPNEALIWWEGFCPTLDSIPRFDQAFATFRARRGYFALIDQLEGAMDRVYEQLMAQAEAKGFYKVSDGTFRAYAKAAGVGDIAEHLNQEK